MFAQIRTKLRPFTALLAFALLGSGAYAARTYLDGDCCSQGAACCKPGAACCKSGGAHGGARAH